MGLERVAQILYPKTFTHPERGLTLLSVIKRKVLADRPTNLHILEVGIGKASDIVSCPYEPYWLAALLESRGVDYSMVLIDKDSGVLDDIARRRRVYAPFGVYREEDLQRQSWQEYLALTGQNLSVVHTREDGLEFTGFGPALWRKPYESWVELEKGILRAAIPAGFARRLNDGRVSLAKGNIVTMDLHRMGEFDLIVSMNTLCYLSQSGQAWTIRKMADALKSRGQILVGDVYEGYPGLQPLWDDFGGWLNRQKAEEFRLALEERSSEDAHYPYVLFRKD